MRVSFLKECLRRWAPDRHLRTHLPENLVNVATRDVSKNSHWQGVGLFRLLAINNVLAKRHMVLNETSGMVAFERRLHVEPK